MLIHHSTNWKMKYLGNSGLLWRVPICSGQYWYALCSTSMLGITLMVWPVETIPKLPSSKRYCPEHTSARSIPILTIAKHCPGLLSSRLFKNHMKPPKNRPERTCKNEVEGVTGPKNYFKEKEPSRFTYECKK